MRNEKYYVTKEKAAQYEAATAVFDELFKELKELGKKKPEATLSESKIKMLNRVLADILECVEAAPERKYLELLDSDVVPQYSDAILMLSQYDGALRAFKDRHYGYNATTQSTGWFIKPGK